MTSIQKRILIAEDNAALARVLQFNLQKAGWDVTVATDGGAAWEHASNGAFDVILTDHQMPGITGVELCRLLRQSSRHAATPLVLLTAKGLELPVAELKRDLRIAEVLRKPFSPANVVSLIASLLAPVEASSAATVEAVSGT